MSFERIAILGLGLLGGSVALAAKRAALARRIAGAGRRRAPLEAALARGVVDEIGSVETVVSGADLVVLATPIGAMSKVLEQARPHFREDALVTDLGSVKGAVCAVVPALLPPGVRFVGSHPMAGSHEVGVEHARADLFDGARCVVTELEDSDAEAVERVAAFWRALGAEPVVSSPERHDEDVAWVSHAPHLLAFAFAAALEKAGASAHELAGSGLRDFTRIARSDPAMWAEILCTNRKALRAPLDEFSRTLSQLADAVDAGDEQAVLEFLTRARSALSGSETVSERDPTATSGSVDPES